MIKNKKEKGIVMFCNKCGATLNDGATFCTNCGASTMENIDYSSGSYAFSKPKGGVNIFVIIAAVILALGTLLPCYSISFFGMEESVAYIEGDGIFVLIAAVIAIVLAIVRKEKFACIPAAISIILLIVFSSEVSKVGVGSYGIGYYMMWIGAVASAVLPFVNTNK